MRTFEKPHLLSGIYDVLKCSEFVLNGKPDYCPLFGNDILTNTQFFLRVYQSTIAYQNRMAGANIIVGIGYFFIGEGKNRLTLYQNLDIILIQDYRGYHYAEYQAKLRIA